MHFYITGGSGRNGSLVTADALARGHTVTALVRNPSSASLPTHANLTLIQGSPLVQSDVQRALATPTLPDSIISTLSLARTSTSPFAPLRADTTEDFMSRATTVLLAAVDAAFGSNTARPKIVINSTLGAGDSWGSMSWAFRLLFSQTPMRFGVADHNRIDGIVRRSGLRFVLARAGRLAEQKNEGEPVAAVKALPDNGKGLGMMDALTRQSLAQWLVAAAEQDTWDNKSPVLIN